MWSAYNGNLELCDLLISAKPDYVYTVTWKYAYAHTPSLTFF